MRNKKFLMGKYWIVCFLPIIFAFQAEALQLNGRLEWVNKIDMRILYDGVITKVNVKSGQQVKKGDLLLQLDSREAKAKLQKAKAQIASVDIKLDNANDILKRSTELYDRGLIAEEELKTSKYQYAAATSEKQTALASLKLAEIALERTSLRAPINGIIVTQNIWAGSVVYKTQQREPLLSIAPNNKMLARILVNANTLNKYRLGQAAKVNSHGKVYNGKIYSQGLEAVRIEPNGAIYELDIIFNHNPRNILRPSDSVQVTIN